MELRGEKANKVTTNDGALQTSPLLMESAVTALKGKGAKKAAKIAVFKEKVAENP